MAVACMSPYFNEDPTVKGFHPRGQLKRAIKLTQKSCSDFRSLETVFMDLLQMRERDKDNYVLCNDLWTWILYNDAKFTGEVQRFLKNVKTRSPDSNGALIFDLHGMLRWTAAAFTVFTICCEMDDDPDSSVAFITGFGKHSAGQPVLLPNMIELLETLRCDYERPTTGCVKVTLSAAFREKWERFFSEDRLSETHDTLHVRGRAARASDVGEEHWNPHKQPGVDCVKKRKLDKQKQNQRYKNGVD